MTEQRDPPIENPPFVGGVNIVDIGDIRVARGMSRRPAAICRHRQMRYDPHERRIWCADCETDVHPFDAFVLVAESFHFAEQGIRRRQAALTEAEAHGLVALAAKAMDKAWRSRRQVPCCPACGQGLFPEDFKTGIQSFVGRSFGAKRRAAINKPVPGFAFDPTEGAP